MEFISAENSIRNKLPILEAGRLALGDKKPQVLPEF